MCYYVPRIKCQRISRKIILHLVMLPSEINLKGHESVLKWSKGGRKRKENKRSHFTDVYFAPSLQHNLWLHLAWREISEKKKEKSYFSACLGCQGLFNSGSRQLSRSSTPNILPSCKRKNISCFQNILEYRKMKNNLRKQSINRFSLMSSI